MYRVQTTCGLRLGILEFRLMISDFVFLKRPVPSEIVKHVIGIGGS